MKAMATVQTCHIAIIKLCWRFDNLKLFSANQPISENRIRIVKRGKLNQPD